MRKKILFFILSLFFIVSCYAGSVQLKPHTVIKNGQKTVTTSGTAEAISSGQFRSIVIKALASNSGNIYVGDSSVDSSNGFILAANETLSMDFEDLALIYIDADNNGEGVCFITTA